MVLLLGVQHDKSQVKSSWLNVSLTRSEVTAAALVGAVTRTGSEQQKKTIKENDVTRSKVTVSNKNTLSQRIACFLIELLENNEKQWNRARSIFTHSLSETSTKFWHADHCFGCHAIMLI